MTAAIKSLRSALAFKMLGWALILAPRDEKGPLAQAIQRYAATV